MTTTEDIAVRLTQQMHWYLKELLKPHLDDPLVRSIALTTVHTLSALVLADALRGWPEAQQQAMLTTFATKVQYLATQLLQTHEPRNEDLRYA